MNREAVCRADRFLYNAVSVDSRRGRRRGCEVRTALPCGSGRKRGSAGVPRTEKKDLRGEAEVFLKILRKYHTERAQVVV